MRTCDFDFELPTELIAQVPVKERGASRLLVLHQATGGLDHKRFNDLPGYLTAGDLVVLNDSKVIPARMRGSNARTGGRFEVLLLEELRMNDWWVMMRPGKRARVGTRISLQDAEGRESGLSAVVTETNTEGHRRLRFEGVSNISNELDKLGELPLPPYIQRADTSQRELDRERYQTVYARVAGSVAAPTAGLHFTERLLGEIRARGVGVCFLTLHVGFGTFAPVKSEMIEHHVMHEERYELDEKSARLITEAKRMGRRVVAVGTTTARVLESVAAAHGGVVVAGEGKTRMFIHPPYKFALVDALVTNFHLPRSTLLMLVSSFAAPGEMRGRDFVLSAYGEAIRRGYRFFSYGDAMLILP